MYSVEVDDDFGVSVGGCIGYGEYFFIHGRSLCIILGIVSVILVAISGLFLLVWVVAALCSQDSIDVVFQGLSFVVSSELMMLVSMLFVLVMVSYGMLLVVICICLFG